MYSEKNLAKIAKRENNSKREYLVVNPLQGKHIPANPKDILDMFSALSTLIKNKYKDEKLLLVGFAETATAIGAAVAIEIGAEYIQTTREIVENAEYIFFSEEHSHATEQKLVRAGLDKSIQNADRIVFVEDEVTTGNTILNIINSLEKKYSDDIQFSVLSILNGMQACDLEIYKNRNIDLQYLVKTNHEKYTARANSFKGDGKYIVCGTNFDANIKEIDIPNHLDARCLLESNKYKEACEGFWQDIESNIDFKNLEDILVLGTEEFMYPAIYIANKINEKNINVKCHATTRSPIAVSSEEDYPLHTRYEIKSLYDKNRQTFIYNLDKYDAVFIATDSKFIENEGLNSLIHALYLSGNLNVNLLRWC